MPAGNDSRLPPLIESGVPSGSVWDANEQAIGVLGSGGGLGCLQLKNADSRPV
jgi:hypothetical protein